MSNADTPAENTGGAAATPTARALADLPNRVRVHALAKLLGSSSREVLGMLADLGETARSPQSSVHRDVAMKVAETAGVLADEGEAGAAETPAADAATTPQDTPQDTAAQDTAAENAPAQEATPEKAAAPEVVTQDTAGQDTAGQDTAPKAAGGEIAAAPHTPLFAAPSPVFLPPEPTVDTAQTGETTGDAGQAEPASKTEGAATADAIEQDTSDASASDDGGDDQSGDGGRRRRRRGRRGRGRGKGGDENGEDQQSDGSDERDDSQGGEPTASDSSAGEESSGSEDQADGGTDGDDADGESGQSESGSKRRRRRRRRKSGGGDDGDGQSQDDPPNTVVHVRDGKQDKGDKNDKGDKDKGGDGVRSVRGSTRLEAKRQRRRDGREAGRRRAPILSESEFLARRESVERTMVVREHGDSTQIGVLEDGVLVEHFVTSQGSGSIVGNVYLGRVQNVLPSMEAAFIDIGRGRNAVLYAGEVDWDAAGLEGKARKIEQALSSGDQVLVQVTKDPVGHKGARLTTQISLPGRFLVYVPSGGATGISRKLPETERRRLKDILKRIVPEDAGVIIRTASEGISEEELDRDVRRLQAQWEVIKEKSESASSSSGKKSGAPTLLYEEPDLLVKVVRDQFTEDFVKLEVQGRTAWETISSYVEHVAPDLMERVKRYVGNGNVFADYRIDEQITKALDRKVWLPSGGYLVIDRTEAMTVIDVNTGKFTGSGGNLEETVTRNNLESAEEIVRQLRLRDIGGIIVIDFIDMVLESNRDLVLRRLTECLGRDRTRHQVAEVTSLGLVQMTRKRVGTGLLEAYSSTCEHCKGRGVLVSSEPNTGGHQHGNGGGNGGGRKRGRGKGGDQPDQADKSKQTDQGRTPEQRESLVTAVQAVANASKAAKHEDSTEGDTSEAASDAAAAGDAGTTEVEQAATGSSTATEANGRETSGKAGRRSRDRKSRRDRGAPKESEAAESAATVPDSADAGSAPQAEALPAESAAQAESAAESDGAATGSAAEQATSEATAQQTAAQEATVQESAAPTVEATEDTQATENTATAGTASSAPAGETAGSDDTGGGARRGRRSARRAAGRPTGPAAGTTGSGVEVQTVMTGTMSSSSSPAEPGSQSNGTSDASVPGTAEQDATSVATVSAVRSSTRRPRRAAGRPSGPPVDDESS